MNNCGNTGIGLVTKAFPINTSTWIGSDGAGNSWGIYNDHDGYYHKGQKIKTDRQLRLTGKERITVDLDMDSQTVDWAINGVFLTDNKVKLLTSAHLAIAASVWTKGDSVTIIQYEQRY